MKDEALFWADQKAREIANRKKFRYLDRDIPDFDTYTIKTSASISGVLHIGRLSDTIRGESVCRALKDAGYRARMIWVAEDMDPLRKIPEGVPGEFVDYIGVPVTDVPDPWGCHKTYAEHHVSRYLEVIDEFVSVPVEKFSMKEEYEKGSFGPFIQRVLERMEEVREIQNRYRERPLEEGWSPFAPICRGCGKIITPRVEGFKDGLVHYTCRDYDFEKHTARGCGFQGEADPLKDPGKLMWKGEWAAQWARWQVACEGAGKEYVVPTSAWWVNAEIAERILDFPMPVPIFYEHLMIDGQKMSASVGNVVYPHQWLEVAPAELLRFFYNKKLMKTRSFSWRDLPRLYDEYDRCSRVYFGQEEVDNEKEKRHLRRLYEISQKGEPQRPNPLPFSHAVVAAQIFSGDALVESLKRSGHWDDDLGDEILKRAGHARRWSELYLPEAERTSLEVDVEEVRSRLSDEQKSLLEELAGFVAGGQRTGDDIQGFIFDAANRRGLKLAKAFQAVYLATVGKTRGPKAGPFLASLDRDWLVERLRAVSG
ncbi:MAG: lysine--tRNA ligase [Euryarchaeota archaeon]|nr:lysine--tRNA ligase [Euryarchaeota archaeon]